MKTNATDVINSQAVIMSRCHDHEFVPTLFICYLGLGNALVVAY